MAFPLSALRRWNQRLVEREREEEEEEEEGCVPSLPPSSLAAPSVDISASASEIAGRLEDRPAASAECMNLVQVVFACLQNFLLYLSLQASNSDYP